MTTPDELIAILDGILDGSCQEESVAMLRQWLKVHGSTLQWVSQDGKFNTNIGQVQGGEIHIGDRTYQGANAETIRDIIRSVLQELQATAQLGTPELKSVDELVQEVRSRLYNIEQQRHGTMLLWRVSEPVPVDEIYVDVEILERPTKEFSSDQDGLLQTFDPGDRTSFYTMGLGKPGRRLAGMVAVEQCFNRNLNLTVLGLPGSGKTIFLQHLLMQCISGKTSFLADRVSVLLRLRDYDFSHSQNTKLSDVSVHRSSLLTYIRQYLDGCSDAEFEQLFQQGRLWILLDGLDEVPKSDSKLVIRQIEQLVDHCGQNRIVLSCRTQATEHRFRQFQEVQIADFNEFQVRQFAYRWFTAIATVEQKVEAIQQAERFMQQIERPEHQQIRELAVTPILLNLTCAVFRDRNGRFYSKRSDLYREGLRLLLQDWDTSRSIERQSNQCSLNISQKEALLSHVALYKFRQSQFVLFDEDELTDSIADYLRYLPNAPADLGTLKSDSQAIRRSISEAHGLFIQRAASIYSYSHLTFQEYFAAREIVASIETNGPFTLDDLVQHVTERRWYEVFLLTAGMLRHANELICLMKQRIDQLFATNEALQEFLGWVHQITSAIETPYKPTAVRALYFDFLRDSYVARALDQSLDLVQDREEDRQVDFKLALDFMHDVARGLKTYLGKARDLTIARVLDHNLAISLTLARDVELAQFLKVAQTNPELQQEIQLFRETLPDPRDWQMFEQWWSDNSKNWVAQIRGAMAAYKILDSEVQLTEEQTEQLQQYYDANKLLVDCIASSSTVSDAVKQNIEEMLLLPTSNIESMRLMVAVEKAVSYDS
jgi:predicted NACHT family NTPase